MLPCRQGCNKLAWRRFQRSRERSDLIAAPDCLLDSGEPVGYRPAMRPLLIGPLATAFLALAVAYYFWAGAVGEWDPSQVDLSKLEEQRHLAECYRVKCGHVGVSPILACAWRELIVEETGRSSPVDVTAAEEACRGLSPQERAIATRAEDDLRAQVKRGRGRAPSRITRPSQLRASVAQMSMKSETAKASAATSPMMWIDPSVTRPARLASSATTLPHSTMTRLGPTTVLNGRAPIRFLQLRSQSRRDASTSPPLRLTMRTRYQGALGRRADPTAPGSPQTSPLRGGDPGSGRARLVPAGDFHSAPILLAPALASAQRFGAPL